MNATFRLMTALAIALATATAPAVAADLSTSIMRRLAGTWLVQGPVMGRRACNRMDASWVLGGAFLRLEIRSLQAAHPYDAAVYIGLVGSDLSAHWLDQFGAEPAQTLGRGAVLPDGASLDFPYPDGAFHDRFTYDPARNTWHWVIRSGNGATAAPFSDWTLTPDPTPSASACSL